MEKNFIFLRGLPGSGKSTFARLLAPEENICTADDYLYVEGKYSKYYKWTEERVAMAHMKCIEKVEKLVAKGVTPIVVANMNITGNDMRDYAKAAKKAGYRIHYTILENRHGGVNSHGVPNEKIKQMRANFPVQL